MQKLCSHKHASLIEYKGIADDFYYEFTGWQCDDCGMLLNRDVTDADLATHTPAKLDKVAYWKALERTLSAIFELPSVSPEVKATQFVQTAAKDARQRRKKW